MNVAPAANGLANARYRRLLWILPLLAVLAAYWPAFGGKLVWDDQNMVENELPRIRTVGDILRPPPEIPTWTYSYYRPVVALSYVVDRELFGNDSTIGRHATNVLFHVLATLLVMLLAAALLRDPLAAALAAGAFAVHPIHTESVSWMTGRSDVLATLFVLAAILASLRWRDSSRAIWLIAAPLAWLLGMLAKESAIAGVVLVPIAMALVPTPGGDAPPASWRRPLALATGFLAALAGWFWLRDWAGVQPGVRQTLDATEALVRGAQALAFYLSKLVVPWPQSNIVTWDMVPGGALTMACVVAGVLLLAIGVQQWQQRRRPELLFMLLWLGATLAVPLWNAVGVQSKTPLAERNLYLPSVAVALAFGWLLTTPIARRARLAALGVGAALLLAYGASTIARGLVWADDLALWQDGTAKAPLQPLPWTNLGLSRLRRGDEAGAIEALTRALELPDTDGYRAFRSQVTLGVLLVRRGRLDEAEGNFRRAEALVPDAAEPQYGLGLVYRRRADDESLSPAARSGFASAATGFLDRALAINAGLHPARLLRAETQAFIGVLAAAEPGIAAIAWQRADADLRLVTEALPVSQRDAALATLARETGVDPQDLANRIARALTP